VLTTAALALLSGLEQAKTTGSRAAAGTRKDFILAMFLQH
jgi:hypothetical protein